MYRCLSQFSCEDGLYFKGGVYKDLPSNSKYHGLFEKLENPKVIRKVNEQEIETASIKKGRKKKKK